MFSLPLLHPVAEFTARDINLLNFLPYFGHYWEYSFSGHLSFYYRCSVLWCSVTLCLRQWCPLKFLELVLNSTKSFSNDVESFSRNFYLLHVIDILPLWKTLFLQFFIFFFRSALLLLHEMKRKKNPVLFSNYNWNFKCKIWPVSQHYLPISLCCLWRRKAS